MSTENLAPPPHADRNTVRKTPFGVTRTGAPASLFTLINAQGMTARITDFGGILTALTAPGRDGAFADVVLGHDALAPYEMDTAYLGAMIGRFGNRIAGGRFTLDGTLYSLATNNGPNHLHGGPRGFHRVLWQGEPQLTDSGPALDLTYVSADGEEGYPGELTATVRYTLTHEGALIIDYDARTTKPTPLNFTHHSYFNLAGRGDILSHELRIEADRYLPIDETAIPLGDLRPVEGSPFDFRHAKPVGQDIEADDEQLRHGGGYDHNFVLADGPRDAPALAATLVDSASGRRMRILTTEPGVQFYSGNWLTTEHNGKGRTVGRHSALCLETQHFPDSPNRPAFPSTILRPGDTFRSRTIHALDIAE